MIIKLSTKSKNTLYYYDDTNYSIEDERTIILLPSKKVLKIRKNIRAQVMTNKGVNVCVINREI